MVRALLAALAVLALFGPPEPARADGDVTTSAPDVTIVLPRAPRGYDHFETEGASWTYPVSARALMRSLEARRADHLRAIEQELGVPVVGRIVIRVARNPDEMRALAPVGLPPPPYAEGVAYPELGIILLALTGPNPSVPVNVPSVFVHELSHVALHRAANRNPMPRWFSEGVAIHQARERRLERARTLYDAYGSGRLVNVRRLDRTFASGDDSVIDVAYAQSASFVAFMLAEPRGRAKLQRLIREVGEGVPFDRAVDKAFYMSLDALHASWRKDLGERYSILPYIFGGTTFWVLATVAIIFGYLRKRRESKARLAKMGEEEAALDELDALLEKKLEALEREETAVPVVSHEGEHHTLH